MATPTRFAVLDLGSTTFQLMVADADRDGSLTPVLRDRVVLNLGRVLAEEALIPDVVAGRAAETARRLKDIATRTGADRLVPLATSALRDGPDREELEELFEGAIGAPCGSSTAARRRGSRSRASPRAWRSAMARPCCWTWAAGASRSRSPTTRAFDGDAACRSGRGG